MVTVLPSLKMFSTLLMFRKYRFTSADRQIIVTTIIRHLQAAARVDAIGNESHSEAIIRDQQVMIMDGEETSMVAGGTIRGPRDIPGHALPWMDIARRRCGGGQR